LPGADALKKRFVSRHRPRRIGLLAWIRKRSPRLWTKRTDIKRIFCSKLTTLPGKRKSGCLGRHNIRHTPDTSPAAPCSPAEGQRSSRWLTAQHATLKHSLLSLRLSPSCATRHRSNGRDTAEGMCRSCPRTEAQEADLLVAPLGQIRLNDIAGWPLLISFAVRTAVGRMAVTPPVRLASVRGPFSRLWPPLPWSKRSLASFLAAPTDRHGRSPTARD
jgi:hypothetical protein